VAAPEVADFVRQHGGRLYVWASHHRCCTGKLTLLEASTKQPRYRRFDPHPTNGFSLFLDRSLRRLPAELRLAMARFPRRHVKALWDGCAWVP
jgi:hypothetical protein